jgi:hypothetical protein
VLVAGLSTSTEYKRVGNLRDSFSLHKSTLTRLPSFVLLPSQIPLPQHLLSRSQSYSPLSVNSLAMSKFIVTCRYGYFGFLATLLLIQVSYLWPFYPTVVTSFSARIGLCYSVLLLLQPTKSVSPPLLDTSILKLIHIRTNCCLHCCCQLLSLPFNRDFVSVIFILNERIDE